MSGVSDQTWVVLRGFEDGRWTVDIYEPGPFGPSCIHEEVGPADCVKCALTQVLEHLEVEDDRAPLEAVVPPWLQRQLNGA